MRVLALLVCAFIFLSTVTSLPAIAQFADRSGAIDSTVRSPSALVSPPKPDTVEGFYSLSTKAGSNRLSLGGASFSTEDTGKLVMCTGIGPTEGRLVTKIAAVLDATHILTTSPATQAMTSVSQRCIYGSDQSLSIQAAFDHAKANKIGAYVAGGTYLLESPLVCLPSPTNNSQNAPGSLCQLDPGATLIAMAPMTAVITYGGIASDYSQYVRQSTFGGGTLDGNFVADYGVDVPFYSVVTRRDQVTKNTRLAGVRYGRISSPTSGGSQDLNVGHLRDVTYVNVSSINQATTPTVTTEWDHGYSTGRVVTFVGVAEVPELSRRYFQITVTGPRTFTLDNADSTSWPIIKGTPRVALTMPSMRVPRFLSGVSNANPGVVSTRIPHKFKNSDLVWLADQRGISLGGIYCVKGAMATTFQLYEADCRKAVDTTTLGVYRKGGAVIPYDPPETVEKFIYYENGIDSDVVIAQVNGVRIGIYANPSRAGYDSKIFKSHFYNYNENGELYTAVMMGGDNTIVGAQIDLPVRYAFVFSGPGNSIVGSHLNYGSGGILVSYDDYASFVRLNGIGTATVIGGSIKGEISTSILGEVSVNGQSTGFSPGYSQLMLKSSYASYAEPDSIVTQKLKIMGYKESANLEVDSLGSSILSLVDRTNGREGGYLQTVPGGLSLGTYGGPGNQVRSPLTIVGVDVQMPTLPTSCLGKSAGTLWNDVGTLKVCP